MIKQIVKKLIYKAFLASNSIKKNELIILATITKTGTHYIRFVLSYYLMLLQDKEIDNKNFSIVDEVFPNSWHVHYFFRKKIIKSKHLNFIGYKDMPRSHFPYQNLFYGSKVIHTYRNPLDYLTILWATKFRFYEHSRYKYSQPFELVDDYLPDYCDQYLSMMNNAGRDIFRISFESLIKDPFNISKQILIWLGHSPIDIHLKAAITKSNSILTARVGASERWQRDGSVPYNPDEYNAFLNELDKIGSVGIWKNYFDANQFKIIETILKDRGINLNNFKLE